MARTHGAANALAFVLCGLAAGRLERCRPVDARVADPPVARTRRPVVQLSAWEWVVVGIQRGAVLGAGYGALFVAVVAIGSLAPAMLLFVAIAAPIGTLLGVPIGFVAGLLCVIADGVTGRRFRPDHLAAAALVTIAGILALAMRDDAFGWLSLVGGPAMFGLLSIATRPIVRSCDRGERGSTVSPSCATSVRTATARCAAR
jgi:hypothetical protein